MRNTTKTLILVLIFLFSVTLVQGIGISPPQLRVEQAPIGIHAEVATLTVMNTGEEPVYLIMKVSCLHKNRANKLRVICLACNRHIGIQRGDLINPAQIMGLELDNRNESTGLTNATIKYADGSIYHNVLVPTENLTEPYNVGDYVLAKTSDEISYSVFKKIDKDEAALNNGYCPFCGASEEHMIFYDFPPQKILDNITLSCDKHPLCSFRDGFMSNATIPIGESAEVKIGVNISDIKEHYGKHWEIRIIATTVSNISLLDEFIVYGAETKFLVDTPEWIPEQIKKQESDNTILFLLLGGIISVVCMVILYIKRPVKSKTEKRKKVISLEEKENKPKKIKMHSGRKIL